MVFDGFFMVFDGFCWFLWWFLMVLIVFDGFYDG